MKPTTPTPARPRRLSLRQVKTLDVHAREWFDRANGNSYFAARVVINYGTPRAEVLLLPFQYGYGDHYQTAALEALTGRFPVFTDPSDPSAPAALWLACRNRGIILRTDKREDCRKRDVVAFGTD